MSNPNEKVPLTRPRVSKKRKNEAAMGSNAPPAVNGNASNDLSVESGSSKSCRVMRLKEGPPPPLPLSAPVSAPAFVQEEHAEPEVLV